MAAERAPAFQFYAKDWLADSKVLAMTLAERGAYITLLSICWQEDSLPTDPKWAASTLKIWGRPFDRLWGRVLPCFYEVDGRLRHKRLDLERSKQKSYRDRGRLGGLAAKAATVKQRASNGLATGQQMSTLPSSISNKKEQPSVVGPPKEPADPNVKIFLTWFQAEYTRRRAGADYLVKWAKHGTLVKTMLHATTLEKLQKYAQILLSDRCEDEFIVQSDRGIEVLAVKFNWLSDRYAEWQARHLKKSVS